MWSVCANIIAVCGLSKLIFHGKTSAKGWKRYQAILYWHLESNIEKLKLVMKINICTSNYYFEHMFLLWSEQSKQAAT